jgi:hypothetical protein
MSVLDCVLDDGGVDPFWFMQHICRKRERDRLIIDLLDFMTRADLPDEEHRSFPSAPEPRTRAPHVVSFGIMKGRWRILKAGVRIWGVLKTALHNWLLDIDGFGGVWNGGLAVSDWIGPVGDMDFDSIREDVPNSISRLSRNLDPRC